MIAQDVPRRFEPQETLGARTELAIGAAMIVVAVPVVVWWRGWPASPLLQLAMVAVALLAWGLRWWFGLRHQGTVVVAPEGLSLAWRRSSVTVPWPEIHRVHRFGDQLVLETTAPHRRFTLSLRGHEGHLAELVEALRERARLLDLRWVESLGDGLG